MESSFADVVPVTCLRQIRTWWTPSGFAWPCPERKASPMPPSGLKRCARRWDLWRGPVLADVVTDRLRDRIGTGLAELRLHAWEVCMEAELDRGRHGEITAELRALVTANPMRERLVHCLMLALYRGGRQARALDVFNTVRERIAEHTGLDPSTDLVQLRDAIIRNEPAPTTVTYAKAGDRRRLPEDLAHNSRNSESLGSTVADASRCVPRQLPAAPSRFVGREAELAALSSLADRPLETGTVVISAVAGMAGIGKTALAARVEPADALNRLMRDMGVLEERIPAELDERAALWRSVLAGRRMLIVLDNAATEAQVQPLLPGAACCLVLVTSRRSLAALEATHVVSLDTLPEAEAVELFVRAADRPELTAGVREVEEVAQLCGRLPLASASALPGSSTVGCGQWPTWCGGCRTWIRVC